MFFRYFLLCSLLILPCKNLNALSNKKKVGITIGILAAIFVFRFIFYKTKKNSDVSQSLNKKKENRKILQNKIDSTKPNTVIVKEESMEQARKEFEQKQKAILEDSLRSPHTLQLFYNKSQVIDSFVKILYTNKTLGDTIEIRHGITIDHNHQQLKFSFYGARGTIEIPGAQDTITEKNCLLEEFQIADRVFESSKTELNIPESNKDPHRAINFTLKEVKN